MLEHLKTNHEKIRKNIFKMLRPGFEPESSARKAEMIGRTTPPEHMNTNKVQFTLNNHKNRFYKWGRSRDSNPSPGIHSPGG